jgi:TRAP-type mannitol/chloroaromatic compound transport system permease small subunit
MAGTIMWLSWPFFMDAFVNNEQSSNAGGLVRWPAKLLIPIGFALLVAAGISHLIKCVGCLRGACADPRDTHPGKSAEEELAEEIAREAEMREAASHEEGR